MLISLLISLLAVLVYAVVSRVHFRRVPVAAYWLRLSPSAVMNADSVTLPHRPGSGQLMAELSDLSDRS